MWEVLTCGMTTYIDIQAVFLLEELKEGQRLEKPENKACLDEV